MQIGRIAVLGGDRRQISAAHVLAERGIAVSAWGLGDCGAEIAPAHLAPTWETAVENADAILLPLPASVDGVRINTPLQPEKEALRIRTLLDVAPTKTVLLGGRLCDSFRELADRRSLTYLDYFEDETLQRKNAVPTAEGAIEIAMRELPVTLHGADTVIFGYGRIGVALGARLGALGARVTVYARRREQLTDAELCGHAVRRLSARDGETLPTSVRVIFNTVPAHVLTPDFLRKIPRNCLLIDLASSPGGFDHALAERLGLRCVWGTALPGKCAPESAGRIIAETVQALLEEL